MEQAVNNFEQSVENVNSILNNIEWMIDQLDRALLSPEDDRFLNLVKSVGQIKDMYNEEVRNYEGNKIQVVQFIDRLQDNVNKLQNRFSSLKDRINEC